MKIFDGLKFYLSSSFKKENLNKKQKIENCKILIVQLGNGKIIENKEEADYIIISSEEKEYYSNCKTITWNEFLEMIPGNHNQNSKNDDEELKKFSSLKLKKRINFTSVESLNEKNNCHLKKIKN